MKRYSGKYSGKTKFLWAMLLLLILTVPTGWADARDSRGLGVNIRDARGKAVGMYEKSHALLIGVSDYTAGWPDLETIPSELDKVESILKKQGFNTVKVMDPTGRKLKRSFEDFIEKYGYNPNDRLLFFYSGHGYSRKNGTKGYLVPTDAPNPDKDQKGFLRKALNMSRIITWSREMESKHALFLFDSCFSGAIFKTKALPKRPPHIDAYTAEPVRQYITAGSAGEEVPAKSVFTPTFVRALEGEADLNRDGYVTGTEMGMFLNEKVMGYTRGQTPQYGKIKDPDLDRGDFVFVAGGAFLEESETPAGDPSGRVGLSSTPKTVELYLNGEYQGRTPMTLTLPPGSYRITAKKRGYLSHTESLRVRRGKNVRLELVLNKETGSLKVTSSPSSGKIYLNGEFYGTTPDTIDHLAFGRYTVEVKKNRHRTWRKSLALDSAGPRNLFARLKPIPSSSPRPAVPPSDSSAAKAGSYRSGRASHTDSTTGMEFVRVKGGCFDMGDTFGDGSARKKPVHRVCVDNFYLGKTEVTQGQWRSVMGNNPSHFKDGDTYPVEKVSWDDAEKFIRKLNARSDGRYRLPTEAEWEYACREGGEACAFRSRKKRHRPRRSEL
ncbi:MAG: SUMF1/EgtB/PvdO family nonheme iron enzyme [Proteobacteria bacterium]|nr:SUMF1/EgtB/PvdO family nonheme iron enzyme [Pseudomonadota bacterium]